MIENRTSSTVQWTRPQKFALRFLCSYFAVYGFAVLSTLGFLGLPRYWYDYLWQAPVRRVASLMSLNAPPVVPPNPSSDAFQSAQVICFGLVAAIVTVIWSSRERQNRDYSVLYQWLRTGIRYLLAYGTIHYGIVTLLRYEFPALTFEQLVTPVADMTPAEVLSAFIGWSWIYTTFLGLLEVTAGVLLLRRETTLLGALLVAVLLSNVLQLNFLFDVPGKTLSPHFALMTAFLIFPDVKRLVDVHLLGRPVLPADLGRAITSVGFARRHHSLLKYGAIAVVVVSPFLLVLRTRGYLFHSQAHPLAGLYEVKSFDLDGRILPPIVGDSVRWRRVVFADNPERLHVQLMNDNWVMYTASADLSNHRIILSEGRQSDWREASARDLGASPDSSVLTYDQKSDELDLRGVFADHSIQTVLDRIDREKFPLLKTR